MLVSKAAVVGAGTMGGQIAQTIAAAGIPVVLKDISEELLQAGVEEARNVTSGQLSRLAELGRLTAEQASTLIAEVCGRIEATTAYESFGDVDFVIEAVPERLDLKRVVFAELDACTPGHAILASNTSSLSISELAGATARPELVIGFHYFYPASIMPLVEVIEGEESSRETVTAGVTFAQAIRKQPITCAEVPGFVVNRILTSGMSEIWRAQEEEGLSIALIDEAFTAARAMPLGPYGLIDLLGLDTVMHVARHLAESYGPERFHVPAAISRLVDQGMLGVKSGGGVYRPDNKPNVEGESEPDVEELVERVALKTLLEACLVLEERVATHRDIDFGMIAGAGLDPRRGLLPPFLKADTEGLDMVIERLERARDRYGERFFVPVVLRRLVAQGRLGQKSGQGYYPYPRDEGQGDLQTTTVKLERRREGVAIAWLANGLLNALSPAVIADLKTVWERVLADGARALVIASANPFVFCAGADLKAFAGMDPSAVAQLIEQAHGLMRDLEAGGIPTVAAVNGLALGGGCELAMACDVRICARSASFAQPEVKLGIIPGFGGTQRLPRLIGAGKALEMNLLGDPILAAEAFELGLANRVVEDHELFDTALAWARRLAGQAPLSVSQIKDLVAGGDLERRLAAESQAFATVFASRDAKEGITAFLDRRQPSFEGR
jgi:enoyl-CoA hydratase/3-hydroxyacyl-CoA dehydrogenase